MPGTCFDLCSTDAPARQSIVVRIRHRDGHWIWADIQLRAIKDPSTSAISGITAALRDISIRKSVEDQLAEANRRLEALVREDSLTLLGNRRAFDVSLAREYRRAQRDKTSITLIMIDVDRFKSFNDRYGHLAGDDCLRRISDAIKTVTRRPADMAGRDMAVKNLRLFYRIPTSKVERSWPKKSGLLSYV